MSLELRIKRQQELAQAWIDSGKHGIIYAAPRFGKIFTTINILKQLKPKTILIAYPDNKIKESWEDDFKKRKYSSSNVTYTTHLSLHKYVDNQYDIVIIDEIHLLSEAQIEATKDLIEHNECVLGLTGTLSKWTEETLASELGLFVIAKYPIEQAISEGVVVDYEITVVNVPLDDKRVNDYKGKKRTEKKQFDSYAWVIDSLQRQGKPTMFLRLARMRIIQNSIAKLEKTRELLKKHKNERVLVFCGVTKIADALGIPSYHSKKDEKDMFDKFVSGDDGINQMAVVKIGNTGVTYKPLNRVIINYFDSNAENLAQKIMRCTAFEFDNPLKKAYIYIVTTDEEVECNWLNKALSMFDKDKIKYL
jgi:superfamily II DNA or RNA helicase